MKVMSVLLIASLAANGILLYRGPLSRSGSDTAGGTAAGTRSTARPDAPPAVSAAVAPGTRRDLNATSLAAVLAGDLRAMVATLQAAQFSPEVIRAIVRYRIAQQYQGRIAALATQGVPFWSSPYAAARSPFGLERAAIEKAISEQVVALLGSDFATPAEELAARKEFDYLPPEKQSAALQLVADFARRIQEAGQAGESVTPLGFERREALARLLNPEEYEQYNLRNASTANLLRNRMRAFDPTEEEYLAIFRLERPIAEKYGGTGGPARQAEVQALTGPIAAALGPERYADYQLKTSPPYIAVDGLAKRLNLPPEAVRTTFDVQQESQQLIAQLSRDPSLDVAVRQQAIAAIVAQAEQRLAPVLGSTGIAAYKTSGAGMWLNSGGRILMQAPPIPVR